MKIANTKAMRQRKTWCLQETECFWKLKTAVRDLFYVIGMDPELDRETSMFRHYL